MIFEKLNFIVQRWMIKLSSKLPLSKLSSDIIPTSPDAPIDDLFKSSNFWRLRSYFVTTMQNNEKMVNNSNKTRQICEGKGWCSSTTVITIAPRTAPKVWPAANKYPPADPSPIGKVTSAEYAKYNETLGIRKNPASPANTAIIASLSTPNV